MWAIIVVAVVCVISIWLRIYSLGGQDGASIEDIILMLPHVTRAQRPLATNHDKLLNDPRHLQFTKKINPLKYEIMGQMKKMRELTDQYMVSHKSETEEDEEGGELLPTTDNVTVASNHEDTTPLSATSSEERELKVPKASSVTENIDDYNRTNNITMFVFIHSKPAGNDT